MTNLPALDLAQSEAALSGGVVAIEATADVVRICGTDAASYLNGQLSQNVERLAIGGAASSFLLQPQGKVASWGRLYRADENEFWYVLDQGAGPAAVARLERFRLRVDAEIDLVQAETVLLRGFGAAVAALGHSANRVDASWNESSEGVDLIELGASSAELLAGLTSGDLAGVGPSDLATVLRCRLGIPAMGSELDESTIPAAARVVNRSADFTKGCYVGQELVARVDSRGQNTPTRLCRLVGSDGDLTVGAELVQPRDESAKVIGRVTSAVVSATWGPIGLGYVGRAIASPAALIEVGSGYHVSVEELIDQD